MKRVIVILLFFTTHFVLAQAVNDTFAKANTLYKEKKYSEAIKLYDEIENSGKVSSELYFNLGNAYYKLNQVAPSIYNYEKALLLDPLNEDAQNNLIIAKRLTLDRIEELPKSIFQKINDNFLQKLSYDTWAVITVLLSFVASFLFLMFYFSYTPSKKRLFFTTSILSFILLITTLAITFTQYNQSKSNIEAIVFNEEVEIKNAPTDDSDAIFTLHEGTKIKVLDAVDDWNKIKLADGKIGWVKSNVIKVL
ncbi:tetratricopeptide repeat protein [Tenacibaculum aiptasiae]|uniref:tetratricopeptide repeat protein n=1 Tax=Tenacibaculum aiptasiae TaxID=426481 RepID=UPI003B5C6FD4